MILNAKFELPGVTPRATRAAADAQISDLSPQPFSESLLAASKTIVEVGALRSESSRAARQQKVSSGDGKAPESIPASHAVQPPIYSQQPAPSQPVLLTAVASLIEAPIQSTSVGFVHFPDASSIVPDEAARDVAETSLMGSEPSNTQSCLVDSRGNQSADVQCSNLLLTGSSLPSSGIEDTKVPTDFSSKAGNDASNAVAVEAMNAPHRGTQTAVQNTSSDAAPKMEAQAVVDPTQNAGPGAVQKAVVNSVQSVIHDGALKAALTLAPNAVPASAFHAALDASAKGNAPSNSTPVSTNPFIAAPANPEQGAVATGHGLPAVTSDQFAAPPQLGAAVLGTGYADVSVVNSASGLKSSTTTVIGGKDGSNGAASDVAASTQHALPATGHAGSPVGSQEATPSGDQGQSGDSTQGQCAAAAQMNSASHAVAANAFSLNTAIAAPVESAPTLAGVGGHAANVAASATSVPAAVPQALPVINTARLIQTMGQSEMRVGMRSTEFGNISISTSATRDSISSQISLDHGELAKVLSAHLPELQARFGSNQAVDVRIDRNGEQARQGAGISGGLSNGSADTSRGGRQQGGSPAPRYSGGEPAEQQFSPAAVTAGDGRFNTRLDIRA